MEEKTEKRAGIKKKTDTNSKSPVKDTGKKRTRVTTEQASKKTSEEKVVATQVNKTKSQEMSNSEKSLKKVYRQLLFSIVMLFLCLFLVVFALTYGLFTYARSGRETSKVTTADFNVILDDTGDFGINQQNSFPVYDEVGRRYDPHTFSLKNLGTVAANYVMKLVKSEETIIEDGCSNNLLADNSIKMQLIKDGVVVKECLLSELNDYVIDSGFIGLETGVNKMYNYELRLWIKSEAGAEVMGKHYHGKIKVELSDPNK